jgi:CIC family chloride channel protein
MDRNISQQTQTITLEKAKEILKTQPRWISVLTENGQASLIPTADLESHIQELESPELDNNENAEDSEKINQIYDDSKIEINLLNFPAMRESASRVTTIDTLQEAYTIMQNEDIEIVYVSGAHGKTQKKIYGIVTREHIERNSKQAY